jgi:hypothetical protein
MSNEFVKNPNTGRPVKVGGRIWTRLVKKGIISDAGYKDPNILCESAPDNPQLKITEINQSLPPEIEAVRGRGKYANKIVKRKLPISRKKPLVEVQQTQDRSDSSSDDDDIQDMILNEFRKSTIQPRRKSKQYTTDTDYTETEYTTDRSM